MSSCSAGRRAGARCLIGRRFEPWTHGSGSAAAVRPTASLPSVAVEHDSIRRGVAEFVGTFALVFVGVGAIANGAELLGVAVAHGLVIAVMASAVGHISGGHFNPAVTFGFLVTRRIDPILGGVYVVTHAIAATAAALLLRWLLPAGGDAVQAGAPAVGAGVGGFE